MGENKILQSIYKLVLDAKLDIISFGKGDNTKKPARLKRPLQGLILALMEGPKTYGYE